MMKGVDFALLIIFSALLLVRSLYMDVETGRVVPVDSYPDDPDVIHLDPSEMQILKDMYYSMDGPNWRWTPNYAYDGIPWVFDLPQGNRSGDPCRGHWQGLYCAFGCKKVCHIYYIDLTARRLNGVLPPHMFNFSALNMLYLSENNIQGQIPPVIQLPQLTLLNLSYNSLNGTIPECLGKATQLNLLYLSNNRLVGSFPETFTDLVNLQYLYLLNNELTGTLPTRLGNLKELLFLNLGVNHFHGMLPASISQLSKLEQLFLNNNSLSGPYPPYLPYSLTKLSLECNKLTGKVPQIFENFKNLTVLKINDNLLTGPPPICLSTLSKLTVLQLHLNKFTGPVTPLFDPAVQRNLANIDLSHNELSGEIPATIFQLPSLRTIAAVKNCFSGTLPETICDARTVNVISLDGLTSSDSCTSRLWDPWHYFKSGYFARSMRGTIPQCIWALPNLTSLHLAGNSFTGKLFNDYDDDAQDSVALKVTDPSDLITPTLKNLSMSHNRLTGEIPSAILRFPFANLDLSYNKLRGHITDLQYADFQNGTVDDRTGVALTLKVNRLSGKIPHQLETAYSIDILTGNAFACHDYSKLPHHDPAYHYFTCGSDELNQSMITFGAIVGAIVVGFALLTIGYYRFRGPRAEVVTRVVALLYTIRATAKYVIKYTNFVGVQVDSLKAPTHALRPHSEKYPNYLHFLSSLNLLRRLFLYIAATVLVLCLPIYLMFYLLDYSTHTDRYNWISTTVYLSGQTPSVALFCMWMAHCTAVVGYVLFLYNVTYKASVLTGLWNQLQGCCTGANKAEEWREHDSECAFSSDLGQALDPEFPEEVTDDTVPDVHHHQHPHHGAGESSETTAHSLSSLPRPSSATSVGGRDSGSGSNSGSQHRRSELRVRYSEVVTEYPYSASTLPYEPPSPILAPGATSPSPSPQRRGGLRTSMDSSAASTTSGSTVQAAARTEDGSNPVTDASPHSDQSASQLQSVYTPPRSVRSRGSPQNSSFSFSQRFTEVFTAVTKKVNFLSILPMSVLFLLNAVAAITVNVVYVITMHSDISSTAQFFIQVLMGAFKLFWNLFVVRKLISHVPYNKDSIRMHSLMLIFNTLVAPCVASAFTDSACFKDLVFGSNLMTTAYSYESCLEAYQLYTDGEFTTICTHYADTEYVTDYYPPFVYNYSCGSSILTSYIPVYIYSYTMLAFLLPLAFLMMAWMPTKFVPKFLLRQVDAILRPQDRTDTLVAPIHALANGRPSGMAAVFVHFQHVFKARSVQALAVQHLAVLLTFGVASPMLAVTVCAAIVIDTYTIQTLMIRYVEYQTRSSVFYNTFNTEGSGSNSSSGGSVRDSDPSVVSSLHSRGSEGNEMKQATGADTTSAAPGGDMESSLLSEPERSSSLSRGEDSSVSGSQSDNTLLEQIHEEERMCELDAICAGTWRCLRHTIWMVYYFCIVFYAALLFDVVGDSRGISAAISVPIAALAVSAFFRLNMATILTELRLWLMRRGQAKYERVKMECETEGNMTPRTSEGSGNGSPGSGVGSDSEKSEAGVFGVEPHRNSVV